MKIEKIREEKIKDFVVKEVEETHFEALGFKVITDSEIEREFIHAIGRLLLSNLISKNEVEKFYGSKTTRFEELGKTYVHFGKWKLSEFYKEMIKGFCAFLHKEFKDELEAIESQLRKLLDRSTLTEDQFEEARECWVFVNIQIRRLYHFIEEGTLENGLIDEGYRSELIESYNRKYGNL